MSQASSSTLYCYACMNTGTYLDTPAHRYEDGWDLTGLPLERCVDLATVVVDVPAPSGTDGPFGFDASHFEGLDMAGAALLLRTGWSDHSGTDAYGGSDHPYLTADGTAALVAAGVALVGIDSLNIDSTSATTGPRSLGAARREHPDRRAPHGSRRVPPTDGFRFIAVPTKVAGLGIRGAGVRHHRRPSGHRGGRLRCPRRGGAVCLLVCAHGRVGAPTLRRVVPGHAVPARRRPTGLPAGARGQSRKEPGAPRRHVLRHRGRHRAGRAGRHGPGSDRHDEQAASRCCSTPRGTSSASSTEPDRMDLVRSRPVAITECHID